MWLSGLDVVAADALALPGYYDAPPVICYLDRDIGAAIRRARTRMPGGGENPVAIIRVPRERMVGTSIASSLVHEVGHQAAALLDLVNSLRPALRRCSAAPCRRGCVWQLWERWISEIVADFWSVARVGIAATLGLIGVVSLPRAFVFRLSVDDPHPMPWIRVKLSAAMGEALYPHPQWQQLSATWESFYPPYGRGAGDAGPAGGAASEHAGVRRAAGQSPAAGAARPVADRSDGDRRRVNPRGSPRCTSPGIRSRRKCIATPPSLVFAVMGQARSDGKISPEDESLLLCKLLTFWALRATLNMSEICAASPVARSRAA